MKLPPQFSIFPVQDKKPLVSWGEYAKRLPTSIELDTWRKQGYTSFGIATGQISKILVLDDDGGIEKLDPIQYNLPRTWTVKTPRGGRHYYFKWIPELDNKVTTKVGILDKVDVRGNGGYVVFYGWEKPYWMTGLKPPPQWLIDLLPDKNGRSPIANNNSEIANKSKLQEILDAIHVGNRNDSFARAAGSFRSRGYTSNDIFTVLLPKAREVGFGEGELRLVCDSVSRYEPKEGFKTVDLEGSNSLSDFLADSKEIQYIVPGFIAENTINIVAGLGESRKSWMLLDLAVAVASGSKWLTKYECKKRKVLIIDQERGRLEMQRRIKALLAGRGLDMGALEGQLVPKVGTTMRINLQQSYEKLCRMIEDIKPDLVLIDSLKTFQTGVITDNQSMQEVFERFKELKTKYNLTFIIIHHESKMGYIRNREHLEVTAETIAGAASIIEVPESIFVAVSHDTSTSMLHHVKNNYAQKNAPFLVRVNDLDETKSRISVEAF